MSLNRKRGIVLFAFSALFFLIGCGDTFRPVATPEPGPGGDPQRLSLAAVVAANGPDPGTATTINVAGDTNVGQVTVGRDPRHAGLQGNTRVYVANFGDDTVSLYSVLFPLTPAVTISLRTGAQPVFLHTTEGSNIYVAESGLNAVAVISTANAVVAEIPVGSHPVALAETPDGTKLYVVNRDSNNVSVVSTADRVVTATIPVGSTPVHAVASSDGRLVFVVNQGSSTVSVIDTSNDSKLTDIGVGSSPNFALYDRRLRRVYVTSPGADTLSVIKADLPLPTLPSEIARVSVVGAPCNGADPVAVAALADGTRAYVANQATNNVCVLSTTNDQFTRSIAVGVAPTSIGSAFDGSKVQVANQGGGTATEPGSASIIRTSDDTVVVTVLAPKQDPACVDPAPPAAPTCLRQTPRFLVVTL